MEIKIHTQHVHLEAGQEEQIRQKIQKLATFADKIADESTTVRLDLHHEESKNPAEAYVCTLTLFVPNETLRAESRAVSIENAIDEVIEKLKAPIERYKDKTNHISERH